MKTQIATLLLIHFASRSVLRPRAGSPCYSKSGARQVRRRRPGENGNLEKFFAKSLGHLQIRIPLVRRRRTAGASPPVKWEGHGVPRGSEQDGNASPSSTSSNFTSTSDRAARTYGSVWFECDSVWFGMVSYGRRMVLYGHRHQRKRRNRWPGRRLRRLLSDLPWAEGGGVTERPAALPGSAGRVPRTAGGPWPVRCGRAGPRGASWRCPC